MNKINWTKQMSSKYELPLMFALLTVIVAEAATIFYMPTWTAVLEVYALMLVTTAAMGMLFREIYISHKIRSKQA